MKSAFKKLSSTASLTIYRNVFLLLLSIVASGGILYVLINSPA
jgi:hypothetical protein